MLATTGAMRLMPAVRASRVGVRSLLLAVQVFVTIAGACPCFPVTFSQVKSDGILWI